MKLFVLGNVGIDKIYYVKKFPVIGETILSTKEITNFGGKGFNQSIAAARIGTKISFWTYLGADKSKNNIIIKNLYLNNKYQIYDFDEILINTLKNEIFNNYT